MASLPQLLTKEVPISQYRRRSFHGWDGPQNLAVKQRLQSTPMSSTWYTALIWRQDSAWSGFAAALRMASCTTQSCAPSQIGLALRGLRANGSGAERYKYFNLLAIVLLHQGPEQNLWSDWGRGEPFCLPHWLRLLSEMPHQSVSACICCRFYTVALGFFPHASCIRSTSPCAMNTVARPCRQSWSSVYMCSLIFGLVWLG